MDDARERTEELAESLRPIDPDAPVSGHVRSVEHPGAIAASPEHDWHAAASLVMPLLRPPGTSGTPLGDVDSAWLESEANRGHSYQVVVDSGPAGLVVVYALPANGFDVIVNADHLVSWHVDGPTLRDAALANLLAWSRTAPWSDEVDGQRRLISSETGDGWDASRILLPEVRAFVANQLAAAGRVVIGVPERHLLVAVAMPPGDPDFEGQLSAFVSERAEAAEEPIDRVLFELEGGDLVAAGAPAV